MQQSLVYAIEGYLGIGDNTRRTQEFIVPHKVHIAIGHINFTYHTTTINHRCYRFPDLYCSYNSARSFGGNVHGDIALDVIFFTLSKLYEFSYHAQRQNSSKFEDFVDK